MFNSFVRQACRVQRHASLYPLDFRFIYETRTFVYLQGWKFYVKINTVQSDVLFSFTLRDFAYSVFNSIRKLLTMFLCHFKTHHWQILIPWGIFTILSTRRRGYRTVIVHFIFKWVSLIVDTINIQIWLYRVFKKNESKRFYGIYGTH